MKKAVCLLLAAFLAAALLTACGKKEVDSAFTAQNEIVTYRRIDPNQTQIVVSRTGNIEMERFIAAFEKSNKDIQVILIDVTGGNAGCQPLPDWVKGGYAPDVVVTSTNFFNDDMTVDCFTNLSTNPILENYEFSALQNVATDANIYWLPGPSDITAMLYNQTLFQKYGWTVPKTFNEFVSLCIQIREDTNGKIEAWNPNAKYSNELQMALEAFTYEELFGGVENRAWYDDLLQGKQTVIGHMEPYYTALQTLVDNGILRPEHFSYSATARGKEFSTGKIAMINASIYDADNNQFDFGYFPFPTTKGELGYLCGYYSCLVGVPKKERTDKQADALDRFLAYFSSVEGQRAFIGNTMKISHIKDIPLNQADDLTELEAALNEGHLFTMLDFNGDFDGIPGVDLYQAAIDMTAGVKTWQECIAETAEKRAAAAQPAEAIAQAKQDMTVLETSFYIADAYRAAVNADIGLIAHGVAYRGNLMRIFAGEITPSFITVLKPRSLANNAKLLKLSMTGRQLLQALNHPVGNDRIADCIYAYAGLRCEVAPWNDLGKRYRSVKLADGTAVDPEQTYTVAAWEGTVGEEYITEVLKTCDDSFEEIIAAQMKSDGIVAPTDDGRIKLVWK